MRSPRRTSASLPTSPPRSELRPAFPPAQPTDQDKAEPVTPSIPEPVPTKTRLVKGFDWDALDKAREARFPPLPLDASDEEVRQRNAEIDADSQKPGRMRPFVERWNGRRWVVWKERYITDADFAAFSKPPANRPTQPSDAGKNESDSAPTPDKSEHHPPPDGKSHSSRNSPEAGQMPVIAGIQWENKTVRGKFTGIEAWHSPDGARNRAGKTYLGKIGKRQLAEWSVLPPAEFSQMVAAWVELKRTAKGII